MTDSSFFSAAGGAGASGNAIPAANRDDPAYWRAKAAAARERARNLPWASDPELRAQVDAILAMEPSDRLRQLQAESDLFASAVLVEDKAYRWPTRHHP